jgi:hypothetical protein
MSPVGERARLKGGDGIEQAGHPAPLGIFPCGVGLNPKNRREGGAESTERGKESRLADALAEADIQRGFPEMSSLRLAGESALQGQHCRAAKRQQQNRRNLAPFHSSRPENTNAESAKYTAI